ncbi:PQ loop repeat-domain-containing protein [Dichotomocladium elegans]|nr:PQ loop repeat-domain-containing protein [Dichotomocladium elegans]
MILTLANASAIAGYLSIICWVVVFTPQLVENYKRKSGEGLSISFLVIWLIGDLFNLVGVILQSLLPTMFAIALYYTVADIGLIWQVLHYRHQSRIVLEEEIDGFLSPSSSHQQQQQLSQQQQSPNDCDETEPLLRDNLWRPVTYSKQHSPGRFLGIHVLFATTIVVITVVSCYSYVALKSPSRGDDFALLPQILGWCSACLYVGSRVPQIVKNWKQKSTEGLSKLLFICAVGGNLFFTSSIFLLSIEPHYILINLSWIVGSVGTLIFDFMIFIQFFAYRQHKREGE